MSNAITVIRPTLDEDQALADVLAKSTLLPKAMQGKMPDVLVTIMAGREMGLAPMASLRAIHVIEGKPVLSADGMIAVILGSGKAVYFERVEESDTSVTYETLRVGSKTPKRCTWTMQQAKAAALHLKDNWRAYPRAMLASRAKSELARDVYPDVLAGCYTEDEIERGPRPEYAQPAPRPVNDDVADAEVVTANDVPLHEQCSRAETVEALKQLAPIVSKLAKGSPERALAAEAYKARLVELEKAAA
jgi:hypothetical protein